MKKFKCLALSLFLSLALIGCGNTSAEKTVGATVTTGETVGATVTVETDAITVSYDVEETVSDDEFFSLDEEIISEDYGYTEDSPSSNETVLSDTSASVSLSEIPEYTTEPYAIINNNIPFFTADEITDKAFETYSELDSLGRCGAAYANICQELMPTDSRGDISSVKPTGWVQNPYDFVDGGYLYNRCHLIAHELAGEDANNKNLITGTRYFNVTGMLPFEDEVCDYVKETDNHVLYRVTPMFDGNNLVADGVLMEAYSVEDNGDGVCYCVFVYNIQPGVTIDYATGNNWTSDGYEPETKAETEYETSADAEEMNYVLNTNSKKFHYPDCTNAASISEKNRQDYYGTRNDLIAQGYSPCGYCKP